MRTKFISDDGTVESDDRKVVEKYEADLNPLRVFGFPWTWVRGTELGVDEHWRNTSGMKWFPAYLDSTRMRQITAFINLVPLIEELRKARGEGLGREAAEAMKALVLAYEKALEESK